MLVMFLIVFTLAAWRYGDTVTDPDLWGHVLGGLDMIEAGGYIGVDQYSYLTEGQTTFNHSWLADVVMASAYSLGAWGLVVAKALLALGVTAFLVWRLARSGMTSVRMAYVGLPLILVLTPTLGTFRPQLFTVVCSVALFTIMVSVESGRRRLVWLLPALFLLWVNLHGGVLAGLGIAGAWALIHFWLSKGSGRVTPVLAVGASVLATLVNPNGWRHLVFLVGTTTVSRPEITDWQSIDLLSPVGFAYLALAGLVVTALTVDRRSINPALMIPLVALVVAPLVSWRHLQLFAPAIVLLGAGHIAALFARWGGPKTPSAAMGGSRVLAVTLTAVTLVASIGLGAATPCVAVDAEQFVTPERAITSWATVSPVGNAIVPFNWGEYVMWQLGPELKVSIDGRRETVYSEEVYQANLDSMNGVEG